MSRGALHTAAVLCRLPQTGSGRPGDPGQSQPSRFKAAEPRPRGGLVPAGTAAPRRSACFSPSAAAGHRAFVAASAGPAPARPPSVPELRTGCTPFPDTRQACRAYLSAVSYYSPTASRPVARARSGYNILARAGYVLRDPLKQKCRGVGVCQHCDSRARLNESLVKAYYDVAWLQLVLSKARSVTHRPAHNRIPPDLAR